MTSTTKYEELGFWRHFAFVRYLYNDIIRYREERAELKHQISILLDAQTKLTPVIKETNNIQVDNISSNDEEDRNDEAFYRRRDKETIEEYLERIQSTQPSISQPKPKVVRGLNEIMEEAKKSHIQAETERLEKLEELQEARKKNVVIADSAIDRIGDEIKTVKEGQ